MTTGTADIAGQRLHNQRLACNPLPRPIDVVRHFGAVQAQDFAGAKWALAQRTPGTTSAGIDALLASGTILRTHVLRPTWHVVAPDDIRWLLALTSPRVHAMNGTYYRKFELDDGTLRRGNDILARALAGGNHLTRPELATALESAGIDASGLRLGYLLMHAELDAVICSGPLRGKQFTYALLDERVPSAPSLERDDAVAELARRYFVAHGPATLNDFAWWSGLTVADGKAGVTAAGSTLASETLNGKTYWFSPISHPPLASPTVHLLPNYDEHLVAYRDHGPSLDPALLGRLDPTSDVLFAHIVVRDGLVIGGWRRTVTKRAANVATELLIDLEPAEETALAAAAAGFGRFLDLPVTVSPRRGDGAGPH